MKRTGRLSIDLDAKAVQVDGDLVVLSAKEYEILELLALRRCMPVSKETFLTHLYSGSTALGCLS